MSDDRTHDELDVRAVPEAIVESPTGVDRTARMVPGTAQVGAEQAADGGCRKADWLAPTTELPSAKPAAQAEPAAPAEPAGDRIRRWGREYGGYLAAAVVTAVMLICAVTALPGVDMTWHSPVAADQPSSSASRNTSAPVASSPADPSPTPSRKPIKRPATASKPRAAASPARSPSPTQGARLLGPADGWAVPDLVDDYCDRRFDRSATLLRPWQDSGARDNWACQRRRRTDATLANMTDACALRYGDGAVARYLDANDPFSWRCYRG